MAQQADRRWNGSDRFRERTSRFTGRIRDLAAEGNRRWVVVRRPSGEDLAEMTLTGAVLAATALTLIAPPVALVGGVVALGAGFRVAVIPREEER